MKINLAQIPEEGLEFSYREPAESFAYLKEIGREGELRVNNVQVTINAQKTPSGAFIEGKIEGMAAMNCGRCLEEIREDISRDFFYDCLPEREMEEEEEELSKDDTEVFYFSGGEMDITAMVQEQVVLAMPIRPLCKEDCKGLCPKCGANLNKGDCGCQKEPVALSFGALKDLKIKK